MEDVNKTVAEEKPWTKGLYEGVVAVDLIYKEKRLEQKNRICLIVLDSTLEIAFKDFLLNHPEKPIGVNELKKKKRAEIHETIQSYKVVPDELSGRIDYFYLVRNQLVHERSGARITDDEIENFRNVVQIVLQKLFGIRWIGRDE